MSLDVDPDALRRAAGEMTQLRDELHGAIAALEAALARRGTPWRHGAFGRAFADGAHGYPAASDDLLRSAGNLVATLGDFASAMAGTADEFQGVDHDSAKKVHGE
jgi:uncharacterized protein YukE